MLTALYNAQIVSNGNITAGKAVIINTGRLLCVTYTTNAPAISTFFICIILLNMVQVVR